MFDVRRSIIARAAYDAIIVDLASLGSLVFQPPAHDRFPALNLAIGSMRSGGLAPTVLNAANEIAVAAFLERRIRFDQIHHVNAQALADVLPPVLGGLDDLMALDAHARAHAQEIIQAMSA